MLVPLNFRLRMMLLFCCVIGALMAATSATVNAIFVKSIRAELDRRLVDAARPLLAELSVDAQKADRAELNPSSQMWLVFDQSGRLLNKSENAGSTLAGIGALPDSRSLRFRSLDSAQ